MVFGAAECFLHHPCCFQCGDQAEIRLVDFEYDVLTYARGLFFCHAFPSLGGFQLRPPLSEVQKRVTGVDDEVPTQVDACPACGTVGSKPPHEPYGEINMARRRSQQTGHVHRQGDGWYLAYREDAIGDDGKVVRVRMNRKIADAKEVSKREAQRIAREVLNTVDAQSQQPMSLLTVEEFVQRRFRPDVIRFKKPAGKSHYENMLKLHVLTAIGGKRLRDVTSDDVQDLVGAKLEAGFSVQTVTHIRNVIGRVFNHAKLKRSYVGDNPIQGVNLPEMERKESHALTFEQGRFVLEALPSPVSEMALVSMTCSLNVAEILALRWKWVNLTTESVVVSSEVLPPCSLAVRQNYYRGEFCSVKADGRRRNVPLSTAVVAKTEEPPVPQRPRGPGIRQFQRYASG